MPKMLRRTLSKAAVAYAVLAASLCGLCVLGLAPWKYVLPAVLAGAATPFVLRALNEPETPVRHARDPILWTLAVVIACAGLLFIHKGDAFLNPQFWAEDAFLFEDARNEGLSSVMQTLDRPQSRKGQTIFSQRVIAYFGRFLPPWYAPFLYVYGALAVTLAAAAYVGHAPIAGLGPFARALLALTITIPPTTEVYLNLINIQWMLAVCLLVILLQDDPDTRLSRLGTLLVLLVAAFTGPFIVLLLPLFLLSALVRRTPYSIALFAVCVPCVAWQLFRLEPTDVMTRHLRTPISVLNPSWQVLFGQNYVGHLFLGRWIEAHALHRFWYLALLAVVYGLLTLYAIRSRDLAVGVLVLASVLCLASSAFSYRRAPEIIVMTGPAHRYYFLPSICLVWALIVIASRRRGSVRSLPAVAALLAVVLAAASDFVLPSAPDLGWPQRSRLLDGPEACTIPVSPYQSFKTAYFTVHYEPPPHSRGAADSSRMQSAAAKSWKP